MKRFLLSLLLLSAVSEALNAQMRMRDVFASAPDSIFPLLTRNNRLDCIDFAENNMPARVKNRFDAVCELKKLTDSYLLIQLSERSTAEMRLLSDSLFCLINTYNGPAPDSQIRFFNTAWQPVALSFPLPAVGSFWLSVPDSLRQEKEFAVRSLSDLTLIHISVSPDEPVFTCTLQTSELSEKEKELAQQYVQPVRLKWNGRAWE
ncbi:MAG: DUF3256 family protein [Bacteroidaceae bacterium]|nr:DUF3256 family protein [Bacteroidaceae bacterium]